MQFYFISNSNPLKNALKITIGTKKKRMNTRATWFKWWLHEDREMTHNKGIEPLWGPLCGGGSQRRAGASKQTHYLPLLHLSTKHLPHPPIIHPSTASAPLLLSLRMTNKAKTLLYYRKSRFNVLISSV